MQVSINCVIDGVFNDEAIRDDSDYFLNYEVVTKEQLLNDPAVMVKCIEYAKHNFNDIIDSVQNAIREACKTYSVPPYVVFNQAMELQFANVSNDEIESIIREYQSRPEEE